MTWGFYMQTIGSRVKALRISKRLNQQQLATLVGVTQPAIAKIEINKTKNIKGYVLESLARALSTTTSYILRALKMATTTKTK
jgi:transcriptional regulator with XRE-family HTH domain